MASKKASMDNVPAKSGGSLAGALLSIIAAGVAGGALLISGAKALGEFLEGETDRSSRRLDGRSVRRASTRSFSMRSVCSSAFIFCI